MQEVTQEYINESIAKADRLYDEAVIKARLNGTVNVMWLSRNLSVNWYGAYHIITRMETEGICEPYQGNKPRKVFSEGE